MNDICINQVILCGLVETKPVYEYSYNEQKIYKTTLLIRRQSGAFDRLPVLFSDNVISNRAVSVGDNICVNGKYLSKNIMIDEKKRLCLNVIASEISHLFDDKHIFDNKIKLSGYVCKNISSRKTPLGREIADIIIAVNINNTSSYIPCIVWGKNAQIASNFKIGDKVEIEGRVQSREYIKNAENGTSLKTAYEVSCSKINIIIKSGSY